jgi:hypothetical protein
VPKHLVNLDALIRREDFEVKTVPPPQPAQLTATMKVTELEANALTYQALRKPDFQRETANWPPEKIADFIRSFLDGDLIPSIILWRSPDSGNIFVIDGAHRLGALIAWVHDDFGDGNVSQAFFEHNIAPEQISAAKKTRAIVKKSIGSYLDIQYAGKNPDKSKQDMVKRARNLGSFAVQLQWVHGDAGKAETSFFKINQEAVPIDPTELRILKARKKPNALAARAVLRAGAGHKYWSEFSELNQHEIEKLAKEIHAMLFAPPLETPIKTLDLPIAGRGYSGQSLPLIFDFVNLATEIGHGEVAQESLADDTDGSKTIDYLKVVRRLTWRICGNHPSSLGLHPAVYFYSSTGRHQPTAFLAVVSLMKDFEKRDFFRTFTKHRGTFEHFLVAHKTFVNQTVIKFGSTLKGYPRLGQMYGLIVSHLTNGKTVEQIVTELQNDTNFNYLKAIEANSVKAVGTKFSSETKSATFLREAFQGALTCKICDGFIHLNALTIDHKQRVREGGTGVAENAQVTHPYCNTTYKQ